MGKRREEFFSEKIVVGREAEIAKLNALIENTNADLVMVYGRRRVGKTYVIKNTYGRHIDFHFTGGKLTESDEHLEQWAIKLNEVAAGKMHYEMPTNWMTAFSQLKNYLSTIRATKRLIVFLDEVPWLDKHKSGFLAALEYHWNDWMTDQNLILVLCGSATSWMLKNIMNNAAGLHNRVTRHLKMVPFTLAETEKFLLWKKIKWTKAEIITAYMALGGIPYYLEQLRFDKSAIQNIDALLFDPTGELKNEFQNLYRSLFDNYPAYEAVVKAIATKRKGLTRSEIIAITKIENGGGLSKIITELEECSFIESYIPYGKKTQNSLYHLTDEYTAFYFHFNPLNKGKGSFVTISQSSTYKSWAGYAFENICMRHKNKIAAALGISGVFFTTPSFYYKGDADSGACQIDMLIDRADNVINICEMKYHNTQYEFSKKEMEAAQNRIEKFKQITGTKKQLLYTLVTSNGLKPNQYSIGTIANAIEAKELF
jgi:uncharacterized protein